MKIDKIIHSNRKTFGLQIEPDGRLIVRAPINATDAQIEAVIKKKSDWIKTTRDRLARTYPDLKPKSFSPGETFWYLGKKYPLRYTNRQRPPLSLTRSFNLSHAKRTRAQEIFREWYREKTRETVQGLITHYQEKYGFSVGNVTITSARTRWGSCSKKNNLNFTFRLSMAPLAVIEYVVVHELVHIKIRNHSKKFWKSVSEILPGYEKERAWLKQNGALLTLD
jgi:hypothetical protein